jgi:F-type H+-transporting ATPase subunit a
VGNLKRKQKWRCNVASEQGGLDPIHQFEIKTLFPMEFFGIDASFTNSTLYMVLAVGLSAAFLIFSMRGRALVPGRWQSVAEMMYEFIANLVRQILGSEGMKFFPLVFTLFIFVLFCNVIGLLPTDLFGIIPVPHAFTVTSHIIITFALAMLVMTVVVGYGFFKHGLGFLKLFIPDVPVVLLPILVPIEVISFLSRPISLSLRLFANMLAGHVAMKVFAGFIISLGSLGTLGVLATVMPFAIGVALTALEFLVAFLQAFVFATLTCIYLRDAMHPSH